MPQVTDAADDIGLVGPDRVRTVLQGALRAAQAAGWTDEALEQASGIKKRRIKSYRVDGKEPSLSATLSLALVLGPRALNPLLALIGYVARPLDEEVADCPLDSGVTAMGALHTFMRAASDKRIDHVEAPGATEAADLIIAEMLPFSSVGQAS